MTHAFSAAADRNKEVIGDALQSHFEGLQTVLEIGSGTGQHAVYFAERFGNLVWQPTDRFENVSGIDALVAQSGLDNIEPTLVLDVAQPGTNAGQHDFVFSANTAHIMSAAEVVCMFRVVATHLNDHGYFALYGPFKYRGQHISPGNESFDAMLRQQASHMGVRDKAELDAIAFECGLDFAQEIVMPANNRLLLWRN